MPITRIGGCKGTSFCLSGKESGDFCLHLLDKFYVVE